MRGRPLHPFAIGRAAGFSAVAIIIVVAAVHVRRHEAVKGSDGGTVASSAASSDPLSLELIRCKAGGTDANDDAACKAAWAENRRRFFTYGPSTKAAPASGTAPNDWSSR